jgi:type IV pilus assembly protein PilV
MSRRLSFRPRANAAGFTLIEVMIAVLVMGVGLLGFALLQTMNVRFTKSAQQRTVATNLAYEIIDIMRSQRSRGSYFNGITYDSFGAAAGACARDADMSPSKSIDRWKCEVSRALPNGQAQVQLQADGKVNVTVRWGDSSWETDVNKVMTAFSVESRI